MTNLLTAEKAREKIELINTLALRAKFDLYSKEVLWNTLKQLIFSEAKRCCLSFYKILNLDWNEFFEDLVQELYLIYEKCLSVWDPKKKDFLGFAKFNFHFLLMIVIRDNYLKYSRFFIPNVKFNDNIAIKNNDSDIIDFILVLDFIKEIEKDKIAKMYFLERKTQQEIAKICNTNQTKICLYLTHLKKRYRKKFLYFLE